MTQETTDVKTLRLEGDGSTVTFPFAFYASADSHVAVAKVDVNGVETELAQPADFTVTRNPDQTAAPGGDIELTTAHDANEYIVIYSAIPATQATALSNQGNQYPAAAEGALDKLTRLVNQLAEKVSRTVLTPITSTFTVTSLPPLGNGDVWVWNEALGALVATPLGSGGTSPTGVSAVDAGKSAAQALADSFWTTVVFDSERVDSEAEYDHTTGVFTANATGVYQVSAHAVVFENMGFTLSATLLSKLVATTGAERAGTSMQVQDAAACTVLSTSACGVFSLLAGQTIRFKVFYDMSDVTSIGAGNFCVTKIR